jgi:hypothetical protein
MALPNKVKKHLPLIPSKFGRERRQEMLDDITDNGTYLPKGVLHADLDRGVLDFVKEKLKLEIDGKIIPTVDKIITNQSWAQFTETWEFQDIDKNVSLPFIITVRQPEVKYGKIMGGMATIPDRLRFHYYTVPTWDGDRKGVDVYKIPQPVPVDITYSVKIFCSRMREINEFNKIMMQTFTSKQAYSQIKGHFMPIKMEDPSDESIKDIEKRKYYIQSYKITLLGFLLDEEEFQVSPGITRQVTMFEVDTLKRGRRVKIEPPRPDNFDLDLLFLSGVTQLSEVFRYSADLKVVETSNLSNCYNVTYSAITNTNLTYTNCSGTTSTLSLTNGNAGTVCLKGGTIPVFSNVTGATYTNGLSCASGYSVYINNNYVGDDLGTIQINDGDTLKIIVYKNDVTKSSVIKTVAYIVT